MLHHSPTLTAADRSMCFPVHSESPRNFFYSEIWGCVHFIQSWNRTLAKKINGGMQRSQQMYAGQNSLNSVHHVRFFKSTDRLSSELSAYAGCRTYIPVWLKLQQWGLIARFGWWLYRADYDACGNKTLIINNSWDEHKFLNADVFLYVDMTWHTDVDVLNA